jgi:serine protease
MRLIRCAAALSLALAVVLPAAAARPTLAPVPGEVIVQFKADAATLRQRTLAASGTARVAGATAAPASDRAERAARLGARVGRTLEAGPSVGERMQVMRARGVGAAALAAQLAADPEVEFAVPNGRQRRLTAPNDPLYLTGPPVDLAAQRGGPVSGQWYLRTPTPGLPSAIDIEAAWARSTGSAGVVVAVLDTGVRFDHLDLGRVADGGPLLPGYDFVSDSVVANDGDGRDGDPSDPGDWVSHAESLTSRFSDCGTSSSSWHGTGTTSLVGAATGNGIGMAGAAPGVRVLPVRVLGKCFGSDADIQAAMLWAAGLPVDGVPANPHPARIINLSLGSAGACSAAYQSVVDRITAAGVVIVAAAGNSAGGPVGEPGNCRGVVGVLALRHAGTKVGFSDLGPEITIAAPGGNCVNITEGSVCLYPIVSATNDGTQGPLGNGWTDAFNVSTGTSFSSPLVAAVAGLMVSLRPELTPAQVRTALQASARPFPTSGADNGPDDPTPVSACHAPTAGVEQLQCYCSTGLCGAGMLDAGAAVAAVTGALAQVDVSEATPTAGQTLTLSGTASLASPGATVIGYAWTLLDGGGVVGAFASATNAATATLQPAAAGTFTVRLTVTDNLGHTSTTDRSVTVAAAPVVTPPDSGGGGGLVSTPWVAGLLLAAVALGRTTRRRRP